jgi:hypothetical protein
MSTVEKQNVSVDDIRRTVLWEMKSPFTITEVVEKLKLLYPDKEEADALDIDVYLDQVSRAGIVEKHRRKWYINKPNFGICPRCGK